MDNAPSTRPSLLVRVRDLRDGDAWSQFVAIYSPWVYRFLRRRGLQVADAADVTQEVFRAVARSMRGFQYAPQRGSFRGWLITVARSKLCNFLSKRPAAGVGGEGAPLEDLAAEQSRDEEAFLDREHRRCLFEWAAGQIRGQFRAATWQAFWQTSVEGRSPQAAAESLGMTVGAVYIARSRVLARLKEKIEEVHGGGG